PVPALVGVERRPGGLPRRRPVLAGGVVPQVEVAPAGVTGHVVVAVPGEPAEPGVQVPGVASGRIRDGAEVPVGAQVVDPRHRRVRAADHVLAASVVEIAVAHGRNFTGLVLVRPWAITANRALRAAGLPDRVRYLRDQLELLLLHVLCGQVSAGQRRGEPALRGDAESLKPGVPGRLVDPRG